MSGAALLVLAGVWVGFQVLGGNALGRLGVSGDPSPVGSKATPGTPVSTPAAATTPYSLIPTGPPASIAAPYPGLIPASRPPASIAAPGR